MAYPWLGPKATTFRTNISRVPRRSSCLLSVIAIPRNTTYMPESSKCQPLPATINPVADYPVLGNSSTIRARTKYAHSVILIQSSSQGGSTMFDQTFERSDALRRQLTGPVSGELLFRP